MYYFTLFGEIIKSKSFFLALYTTYSFGTGVHMYYFTLLWEIINSKYNQEENRAFYDKNMLVKDNHGTN